MSVSGIPETDISGTIPEVRLKVDMILIFARSILRVMHHVKAIRNRTSEFTMYWMYIL